MRSQLWISRSSSGSVAVAVAVNAAVVTKSCFDPTSTSSQPVYRNHGSTSAATVLAWYWPSSCAIHSAISALIIALASPLPLPLLLLTSRDLLLTSDWRVASTTQYRALFSPNHVYSWTARNTCSSFRPFLLCSLLECFRIACRFWVLKSQSWHWKPLIIGSTGCGK